jgi:hypothetical protein
MQIKIDNNEPINDTPICDLMENPRTQPDAIRKYFDKSEFDEVYKFFIETIEKCISLQQEWIKDPDKTSVK